MRRPRCEQLRAFTLIEVLIVVVIIGIVGAVVVPEMLQSGSMTVQAAGRIVIADLIYAQNEAIAQQSPRRVVFHPTQNRYELTDSAGNVINVAWKAGGATVGNYIVDFANDKRFLGVSLGAIAFGTETFIEFDDLGTPSDGGTVDLIAGVAHYRISVAPMTGRIAIAPVEN